MTSAESAALTAHIVELRDAGLSWQQIANRVDMTRPAVRERYLRSTQLSERQQRKHAEALAETLRVENLRLAVELQATHAALIVAVRERDELRALFAKLGLDKICETVLY